MTVAQEVKVENRVAAKSNPLTPALSPNGGEGEREPIGGFSRPEFDWIFQVGAT
jgi:hypothetical protein